MYLAEAGLQQETLMPLIYKYIMILKNLEVCLEIIKIQETQH